MPRYSAHPVCRHCHQPFNTPRPTKGRICDECYKDGHRGNPALNRCAECLKKRTIGTVLVNYADTNIFE